MNWWDRELLRRAQDADTGLGWYVLELLHHSDDGELPAQGMRAIGERYSELGGQLLRRADDLAPGTTRWWRSNRDLRVHAWPVPLEVPYHRTAVCGHTAPAADMTRHENGEPCFTCADMTDELYRVPRWARELPRAPRPPGTT